MHHFNLLQRPLSTPKDTRRCMLRGFLMQPHDAKISCNVPNVRKIGLRAKIPKNNNPIPLCCYLSDTARFVKEPAAVSKARNQPPGLSL